MKPYDKDAKCPKCGHGNIKDEHWDAVNYDDTPPGVLDLMTFGNNGVPPSNKPERIWRECQNCKFHWPESPLDSAGLDKDEDEDSLDSIKCNLIRSNKIMAAARGMTAEQAVAYLLNGQKRDEMPSEDLGGIKKTCEMAKPDFNESRPLPPPMPRPIERDGDIDAQTAQWDMEVNDVLTIGIDDECEHAILARPTIGFWCVSGFSRLFSKAELMSHFTLLRKGPEVYDGGIITKSPTNNIVLSDELAAWKLPMGKYHLTMTRVGTPEPEAEEKS
jgi:hypothetical protein